jgi:hypothetical protein
VCLPAQLNDRSRCLCATEMIPNRIPKTIAINGKKKQDQLCWVMVADYLDTFFHFSGNFPKIRSLDYEV